MGTDGWEDGADGGAGDVERAFREVAEALAEQRRDTAERIAALDASLARATGTLGALVRTEYAGELAGLRKGVDGLARRTEAAAERLGRLDAAAAALPRTSDGLRERTGELARHLRRLDGLCGMLDRIVERPAAAARQGRNLLWCLAAGVGTGLLLAALGLWALPDRMETAAARTVMGVSHWDAAWRMMDAHGTERSRTLGVLTWVDAGREEAERHRLCRDRARETGQPQRCAVTFRPR